LGTGRADHRARLRLHVTVGSDEREVDRHRDKHDSFGRVRVAPAVQEASAVAAGIVSSDLRGGEARRDGDLLGRRECSGIGRCLRP